MVISVNSSIVKILSGKRKNQQLVKKKMPFKIKLDLNNRNQENQTV